MTDADDGAELLDQLAHRVPDVVALAEAVCLAAVVGPDLLRAARLELVPHADAGTEADLWFGPLVQSAGPSGLVLESWAVQSLWRRLAKDQDHLDHAFRVTRRLHRHEPPTVRMADKLAWLGLSARVPDRARRIEFNLRQVLAALVAEDRVQLAYWVYRTLPRLPNAVSEAESYAPLAWAAMARLPHQPPLPVEIPAGSLRTWFPAVLPKGGDRRTVGLRRERHRVVFSMPPAGASHSIDVPALDPVVIEVARPRAPASARSVLLGRSTFVEVPADTGELEVRTALGELYRLPAYGETGAPRTRFAPIPDHIDPGRLGAVWDGRGVHFALFSGNAEKVELCLFDAAGEREVERLPLPEYTDEVWHGYLPGVGPGAVYGYRVHGPYEPLAGHRFNPNKLLLDPYAKRLVGAFGWSDARYGYKVGSPKGDLSFSRNASTREMLKCMVVDDAFDWKEDRHPRTRWEHTILYHLHVRGYTMRRPDVPKELRGTYLGLTSPAVLERLKKLGITAVNLLPVQEFIDAAYLCEMDLKDYWGFNTIGPSAPTARYAVDNPVREFKEMVARFHEAGIEVILDVVYNHTAEGNEMGPTLSFKGIDNASYYRLIPDQQRYYINDTGTGNTLNLSHPRVLQMVTDSLRYWVTEMHVDGFRFDLATILGREPYGFDEGSGFLHSCRQDPVLSHVKLIAESWDLGPGGYQVGNFPPGWAEWNDRYRDTVRAYWKGDEGKLPDLAARLTASGDLFNRRGRKPWASVNFITAHDGFTLADLVSYKDKHNEANGEGNRDGHSHNLSWNHGVEGPTDDPEIKELRLRQMRNMLATLMFSQGTPMLLAGDEFGNTQHGNNNAYCQDNDITWLDWEGVDRRGRSLERFTRRVIALRRRCAYLSPSSFLQGIEREIDGQLIRDVTWIEPSGHPISMEQWQDPLARCMGILLDGRAATGGTAGVTASDRNLLLLILNAGPLVHFALPPSAFEWTKVLDTADTLFDSAPDVRVTGSGLDIKAHSLVALFGRPRGPGSMS